MPLLERTGRRVVLTPAGDGAGAARGGRAGTAGAGRGRAGRPRRHRPGRTVRIGAFPTADPRDPPAALAALAREHPGLEPMVAEIDPAEVAAAAARGRAGRRAGPRVRLRARSSPDLALDTEDLLDEPMYLADAEEPRSRPPSRRGPGRRRRLTGTGRDAPWITSTPGTLCHTMTVRACQAAGFAPRIRHHIDDFATVLAMVAAGQGVALVPELGAADPPDGVRLTELPMRRRTRIAFRRGAGTHPAVAALIAALRSSIPADHPEFPAGTLGIASHQG